MCSGRFQWDNNHDHNTVLTLYALIMHVTQTKLCVCHKYIPERGGWAWAESMLAVWNWFNYGTGHCIKSYWWGGTHSLVAHYVCNLSIVGTSAGHVCYLGFFFFLQHRRQSAPIKKPIFHNCMHMLCTFDRVLFFLMIPCIVNKRYLILNCQ